MLSTSIDKYCYLICRHLPPFFNERVRVVWSKIELGATIDEVQHPTARETAKYLGFKENIEIHHHGDLPARSGLGSSSAFTVGLLHALRALKGEMVSKHQLAQEAIHIEQDLVKDNVGCQDQMAVAFGGLNRIRFAANSTTVEPIILSPERSEAFQGRLMLFFTGLSRIASDVAAGWIKNTPRNEKELQQLMKMVDAGVDILTDPRKDIDQFGDLLHEVWSLKRGLHTDITNPFIDDIYAKARRAGALGGKLLGAGSGGFILIYARPEDQLAVRKALGDLLYVPFRFDQLGSQVVFYSPDVQARALAKNGSAGGIRVRPNKTRSKQRGKRA